MKAEQKAKELIDEFIAKGGLFANSIECALICIEEILNSPGDIYWGKNEDEIDFTNYFTYWKEVREELQKLKK